MERHFTLPIAVAAALHAALLFTFPRVSPKLPPPPETRRLKILDFDLPPPEPAPVAVPEETESSVPRKGLPAPPVPTGAEPPPVVDPGTRPTIDLPPVRPSFPVDRFNLPGAPSGMPNGDEIAGRESDVIGRTLLDNAPRTRFQAAPFYPFEARREGLGGDVVVEFVVDEEGRVMAPKVVRSTHRVFEEPALRAVARWQFEPGRRNGRIVRFRMSVPLIFSVHE